MLTILDIYVTINVTVCVTINSMLLFFAQVLVYTTNFDLIWRSDIFCYWLHKDGYLTLEYVDHIL